MPFYDKNKSRIKMVVLTKNGYPNQTVYSPVDQNEKPDKFIMQGMLRRWKEKDIIKIAQVIQFYDNITNNLIEKVVPK
ncbi:MAG: hypothetical protein ACK4IZ_03320 [Flavobacterium sp.]|uniref:hypothetical protein n=1 Tax=Flavobacterium sp. TaxID=239 RepID=UPI003919E4DB